MQCVCHRVHEPQPCGELCGVLLRARSCSSSKRSCSLSVYAWFMQAFSFFVLERTYVQHKSQDSTVRHYVGNGDGHNHRSTDNTQSLLLDLSWLRSGYCRVRRPSSNLECSRRFQELWSPRQDGQEVRLVISESEKATMLPVHHVHYYVCLVLSLKSWVYLGKITFTLRRAVGCVRFKNRSLRSRRSLSKEESVHIFPEKVY